MRILAQTQKPIQKPGSAGSASLGRASARQGATVAPPAVHEVLHSSGQPLASAVREFMEPRFGYDFSRVRVHADGQAANAARAVQARAYTVGRDIVFGDGQYQPSTSEGRRLLAHELTHVMQQRGSDAGIAHRQAAEPFKSRAATLPDAPGATERLRAIIADIERVQANASRNPNSGAQEDGKLTGDGNVEKISNFVEQLRSVANGNNEELKLRVLTGFSSQGIQQAEAKLAKADTTVREQRREGVAAKALKVSHPEDAAEIEADRVAQAVVHGEGAKVTQNTPGGMVNRQAEALAAAGASVLAFEAETLPATSWNPPGWVIIGVETVVGLALLGAAAYVGSRALRRCRCTIRYAPPDLMAQCPDRVYGTGITIGDCQNVAKFTAPQKCRQYYGHCSFVP